MNRMAAYAALNVAFLVLVTVGGLMHAESGVHPLYLVLLFATCSSTLLYPRQLNDRYALLAVFSAIYFLFFGVVDCINLVTGIPAAAAGGGFLSMTEAVILVGGALAHLGYHLACRRRALPTPDTRDWPERTLVLAGGVLWVICTWLTWQLKINIVTDSTIRATQAGLGSISGLYAAVLVLGAMLQPLGILVLAYAQCVYRRQYMMPLLIGVALVQVVQGFVADIKGDVIIGAVLIVLTKILVDGKLPKAWLVAFIAFILVAFPVLQANRYVRGTYGVDRTYAARNLGEVVKRAFTASNDVKTGTIQAARFHERLSLKGSVELIVSRTGRDVAFQHGYTLTPMLTAFIPRLIWPGKPDILTGQIMNREFQVSPSPDTYISPSHLGELYWNFGWPGVVFGMTAVGLLLGFLGSRFSLAEATTLTRLMVIVVAIRFLILASEGSIAVQYVVWMRSMLAIGLLHLALAALPISRRQDKLTRGGDETPAAEPPVGRPYSNLMN